MRGRGEKSGMLAVTLTVGIAFGAIGATVLGAQPPPVAETPLLRADLAGLAGHELIVSRLDAAPGWWHGRHHHAGHEIVYVLEGTGRLEVEGKPPLPLTAGMASYVPAGHVHAGGNASKAASFSFLLVRIHEKGQPLSVELN
jgi:quercetin dioxygenase-like cupin family protein